MNVVVVVIDSLRKDHVGAYGNEWIRTPHLDKFASESICYENAFAESLPTLPVRRALHTGIPCFPFPELDAAKEGYYAYPAWGPIPLDQPTVSGHFKNNGFRTGLISDCYHMFKANMNYNQGFDSWKWIRGQEVDAYVSGPQVDEAALMKHIPAASRDHKYLKAFMAQYLRNNMNRAEEDRTCAMVFREGAEWIQDNLDSSRFYLMLDSFDPHEPWMPPEYYRKMYDEDGDVIDVAESLYYTWEGLLTERELKRIQANYAGLVTMVDRWFGHFMESLVVSGAIENTIVAVISDHGHNLGYRGDAGRISKEAHPMTRAVAELVLMIRHPGGTAAGTRCEKFVYDHDLPFTVMKMAGVEPYEEMKGVNIWKAAIEKEACTRDHITCAWGTAVTVVTETWWYNSNVWGEGARLFDRKDDPYHERNIAEAMPDVCSQMLQLAMDDAGGADKLPHKLIHYKERSGCRLNGFAPQPYAVTGWCFKEG